MPESETKPLPQWLKITLHTTILLVTGLAGLSQLPSVATSLGLSDVAKELTLAVAGAGWVCTYLLKSPIVLGWLSLHDPEDVAVAAENAANAAQRSKNLAQFPDSSATLPTLGPIPPVAEWSDPRRKVPRDDPQSVTIRTAATPPEGTPKP